MHPTYLCLIKISKLDSCRQNITRNKDISRKGTLNKSFSTPTVPPRCVVAKIVVAFPIEHYDGDDDNILLYIKE